MTHPPDLPDPLDPLNRNVDPLPRREPPFRRFGRSPVSSPVQRVRPSPRARRNIVVGLLATLAFGLAFLAAAWSRACAGNTCPSIEELGGYDPSQASKVYAADGRLITDLGLERRTVIPLGEMSPY